MKTSSRACVLGIVCVLLTFFFLKLTSEIAENKTSLFDAGVTNFLHEFSSAWLIKIMRILSALASLPAIVCLFVAGLVASLHYQQKLDAIVFALVVSGSEGTNLALKNWIARPRPHFIDVLVEVHSSSFPSGHSMAAASVFTAVAFLVAKRYPTQKFFVHLLAFMLTLGVGASRIVLGAHFPTDVLGGFCAGFAFAIAGELFLEVFCNNASRKNKEC